MLAAILDVAVKDRRLSSDPARGANLPKKSRREHVYLSHQQLNALATASADKGTLVRLLGYTGLCWGEAIGLRAKVLDMLRRRINVTLNAVEVGGVMQVGTPESHKRRSVPLPAFLSEALAKEGEGKTREDLVFADKFGRHLKRTRVSTGKRS